VLDEILQERLPFRGHRRNKRGVKRKMSNFPLRRKSDKPLPPRPPVNVRGPRSTFHGRMSTGGAPVPPRAAMRQFSMAPIGLENRRLKASVGGSTPPSYTLLFFRGETLAQEVQQDAAVYPAQQPPAFSFDLEADILRLQTGNDFS
jgi:hypothetical protein